MQCSRAHMCVCVCMGGGVVVSDVCVSAQVCSSNGCWNLTNNNIFIIVCSSVQRKKNKVKYTEPKQRAQRKGACIVRFGQKGCRGLTFRFTFTFTP